MRALHCAVAILVLAACGTVQPYPNTLEKNVRIVTRTDDALLSSVRTALDVYAVDVECRITYQGTVSLGTSPTLLGLPIAQPAYLVFVFESASFLGGTRSTNRYETVFTPAPAAAYEFEVSYANRIYGVTMRDSGERAAVAARPLGPAPCIEERFPLS